MAAETPPTATPTTSSFTIKFQTKVDTQSFVLGKSYTNSSNESFTIDVFKYYVSNIKLTKTNDSIVSLASQYFIVDANGQETITATEVPLGSYKAISFDIGVDSAHNVAGAQTGALAPSDMFWNWNTGYIFLMVNGSSPASTEASKAIQYHISGFRKSNFAIQTIQHAFPTIMVVKQNTTPNLHYFVNILELFKNPVTISIASLPAIHLPGKDAVMMSKNYQDMFQLNKVTNP